MHLTVALKGDRRVIQKGKNAAPGSRAVARRPKRRLTAVAAMIGVAFAGGAGVSALAQQAAAPAAANLFQEQATKLGAKTCTGLYSALGGLVAQGSTHAVRTQTNKESPDTHLVRGTVGMTYNLPELKGQAAGVVLAAPRGKGCEGQFVRVAPFQRTCQQMVGLLPKGSATKANLSGVPLYELGGGQGQALMIASGQSCVVVTITDGTQGA